MPQQSFAALGVSADIVDVLASRDIVAPFQIQTRALPAALEGRDVLAKSPTGSGKTLAFAIPIVQRVSSDARRPAALILVPTRELALQVTEELASLARTHGLTVAVAYGGVPLRTQRDHAPNGS